MKVIHVAAGVIRASGTEILLAKRPDGVHQGGLWEFPGGKVEAGESAQQALRRELMEELGIAVKQSRPLIQIHHDYSDKSVLLDVWEVSAFSGVPRGREGQQVRWVPAPELKHYAFPAANTPIVAAACLPEKMLITGESPSAEIFRKRLQAAIEYHSIDLVQLRAPALSQDEYLVRCRLARDVCEAAGASLIANTSPAVFRRLNGCGLHINGEHLQALSKRPVAGDVWFSASCHNCAQIEKATQIGVDFITLSPVCPTRSHPWAETLGWALFGDCVRKAKLPVFALGGLSARDVDKVRLHGGQGVAAINAFWNSAI